MQQQSGMPPFSPAAGGSAPAAGNFDHDGRLSSAAGDEHGDRSGSALVVAGSFDHEGDRSGGSAGNRWPRQETLALLKIRSEMDAAFREAALKGPLWEEVARKLEAMGYKRSAKKCREKFENVDKYYKRTKDGRAGRGDGKTYRFFSELEALHGASSPPASLAPTPVAVAPPAAPLFPLIAMAPAMHAGPPHPPPVVTMPPAAVPAPPAGITDATTCTITAAGNVSFSSSSDGEDTDETAGDGGKRKRRDGGGGSNNSKMMRFFEGLMRQVMERQEEMQQRFIEAIERREQDRMIREEAWRRQEVARLAREQDALSQERAMAASRDAAVVSFIQRITGQTIPMPPHSPVVVSMKPMPVASAAPAPPPPPQQQQRQPPSIQLPPKPHTFPMLRMTKQSQQPQATPHPPESKQEAMIMAVRAPAESSQETTGGGGGCGAPSPSRWPKAEVHALIQLRTELEARYQDAGAKGPLWEDISAGMRRLGYNRNAKRCKEKWENINKYFKKVKESNRKRPEDSKTCPYYHQLDALYRSKALLASSGGVVVGASPHSSRPEAAAAVTTVLAAVPLSQITAAPHQAVPGGCDGNNNKDCTIIGNGNRNGCATKGMQTQGSNGTTATKKEDMMMTAKVTPPTTEEMPQPVSMNDSYVNDRMDADDSDDDSMDDDEDDDFYDDDEDDVGGGGNNSSKTMHHQYEIQFQRQQQQSQQSSVVRPNASAGAGSGPGPATTSGSFLTMVHH